MNQAPKTPNVRRMGILGGTFDPPHLGHLVAAERAMEALALQRVLFIPNGRPPHKEGANVTDGRHRYLMTVLATLEHPAFEVSRIELDRRGPAYTVDTLAALHEHHGPGVEFHFIVGADALLTLGSWRSPEMLLELCHLVGVARPGFDLARVPQVLGELYAKNAERIRLVEIPLLDVAAQTIRQRVADGRSIRFLVPELVRAYIEKHDLYDA